MAEASEHPDLTGLAGSLRAEWRAEQEAATADALAQRRLAQTLAGWLRDRMHAGDRIVVEIAGRAFSGTIEEVGDDLVALRTDDGRVELHVNASIAATFAVVQHATAGGIASRMRRTFRDALVARDAQGAVRVGTVQRPEGVEGTLLVSRDFVTIVAGDGDELVVPIAHVAWVAPQRR